MSTVVTGGGVGTGGVVAPGVVVPKPDPAVILAAQAGAVSGIQANSRDPVRKRHHNTAARTRRLVSAA